LGASNDRRRIGEAWRARRSVPVRNRRAAGPGIRLAWSSSRSGMPLVRLQSDRRDRPGERGSVVWPRARSTLRVAGRPPGRHQSPARFGTVGGRNDTPPGGAGTGNGERFRAGWPAHPTPKTRNRQADAHPVAAACVIGADRAARPGIVDLDIGGMGETGGRQERSLSTAKRH
jgi:hypothetical protein